MNLEGEYRLPASRDTIWQQLNDPETLKSCIPACESLERTAEGSMAAVVVARLGILKVTFHGTVRIENAVPPERWTMVGEGKGGLAGFASGRADIELTDEGDLTLLRYAASAEFGGRLAQFGGRLVDSAAEKLTIGFFERFAARLEAESRRTVSQET